MDTIDQTVRDEGGLPKDEDPERELLESLADRWVAGFSGPGALLSRLSVADEELLALIIEAENEEWSEAMATHLAELAHHLRKSGEMLRSLQMEAKQDAL